MPDIPWSHSFPTTKPDVVLKYFQMRKIFWNVITYICTYTHAHARECGKHIENVWKAIFIIFVAFGRRKKLYWNGKGEKWKREGEWANKGEGKSLIYLIKKGETTNKILELKWVKGHNTEKFQGILRTTLFSSIQRNKETRWEWMNFWKNKLMKITAKETFLTYQISGII